MSEVAMQPEASGSQAPPRPEDFATADTETKKIMFTALWDQVSLLTQQAEKLKEEKEECQKKKDASQLLKEYMHGNNSDSDEDSETEDVDVSE